MSDIPSSRPKGQNDPGWNDPPKLQFNAVQAGSKTRLNLNKRVAFPLQGNTSASSKPTAIVHPSHSPMSTPPVAIVPPMARAAPASEVPTNPATNSRLGATDESGLSDSERQMCLDTFNSFVPCIQAGINIRPDEVQRRINLMNQMWLSGTLTPPVQRKIQRIANAMSNRNFHEAIESHRALVVDHSNVCVAWGAALRQIILTIQPDNAEITSSEQDQAVLPGMLSPLAPSSEPQSEQSNDDNPGNEVQHI